MNDSQPTTARDHWWADHPPWPPNDARIAQSVREVLRSGDWGIYDGDANQGVRETLRRLSGVQHVRLMASGSAAIEWALRALRIESGKRVAISAWDYPGILRGIEVCGGRPVLVDIESERPTMDPSSLDAILGGPEPIAAVVVSHLFGVAADMAAIMEICRRHSVAVIEDACQVPGMMISDRWAGSIGDIGLLSFGGSKPLSAGNGGAIITSQARWMSRLGGMLDRPSDASPLSSIQAAALLPQFETLDELIDRRNATAKHLAKQFATFAYRGRTKPSHYKFAICFDDLAARDQAVARSERMNFPLGKPFRSLDTMNRRRCDQPLPIQHAGPLSNTTAVLDHRMLLTEPDRWADLVSVLSEITNV